MESTTGTNTFGKEERLCRKLLIDQLFSGKACSFSAWPIRGVFLLVDDCQNEKAASTELLISVSKRFFKRAVKRNRVKRQIREAYRKNKALIAEALEKVTGKKLMLAVIWQDAKLHDTARVESKIQILLRRVADKLLHEEDRLPSCSKEDK